MSARFKPVAGPLSGPCQLPAPPGGSGAVAPGAWTNTGDVASVVAPRAVGASVQRPMRAPVATSSIAAAAAPSQTRGPNLRGDVPPDPSPRPYTAWGPAVRFA